MLFKSVRNDSGPMPKGEYEVYVKDCGFAETKGGTECIKFEFVVRSDVVQECQNRHMFKQFYRDRDTNRWPMDKIGKYANTLGIQEEQDFELAELIGRNCIMVVSHYQDEKTGDLRDFIYYLKPSKADSYVTPPPGNFEDIDDDDGELPF